MKYNKYIKNNIVICLSFFIGFLVLFWVLQNQKIYNHTLGKISHNYCRLDDGGVIGETKPYQKISAENMLNWDSTHYHDIKEKGYAIERENDFAFFPLFPYLWKLSTLSPSHVIFLNFGLFMVGLLLLSKLLKWQWRDLIFTLSLPMVVVFLIPYTEASFLLFFAIAFLSSQIVSL